MLYGDSVNGEIVISQWGPFPAHTPAIYFTCVSIHHMRHEPSSCFTGNRLLYVIIAATAFLPLGYIAWQSFVRKLHVPSTRHTYYIQDSLFPLVLFIIQPITSSCIESPCSASVPLHFSPALHHKTAPQCRLHHIIVTISPTLQRIHSSST